MQLKTILLPASKNENMALRLQSSVHGKIRRLLMVLGNDVSPDDFISVLVDVIKKKPKHVQLIVIANTSKDAELITQDIAASIIITNNANETDTDKLILISPQNGYFDIKSWARDPFMILENDVFFDLVPYVAAYTIDLCTPSMDNLCITAKNQGVVKESQIIPWISLEGGDIIVLETKVLIGGCGLYEVMQRLGIGLEESLRMFAGWFDVVEDNIIPILENLSYKGKKSNLNNIEELKFFNNPKNWFFNASFFDKKDSLCSELVHIDIYISGTGNIDYQNYGKSVIFIAKLEDVNSGRDANEIKRLNQTLDDIECKLETHFSVLRNPIPCIAIAGNNAMPEWSFLFYNNCIVENACDYKCVWLPSYLSSFKIKDKDKNAVMKYQNYNEQLWKALGFTVIFIEGEFISFSQERGGLHCLTNEIIRR